jgi:hypothetical protein
MINETALSGSILFDPENIQVEYDPKHPSRIISIEEDLPDSVEFRASNTGTGVFTTKSMKKGDVIYTAVSVTIPNENFDTRLKLRNRPEGKNEFRFNSFVHAVMINEKERELFPYDSFMNHSCNPNAAMDYSDLRKHTDQSNKQSGDSNKENMVSFTPSFDSADTDRERSSSSPSSTLSQASSESSPTSSSTPDNEKKTQFFHYRMLALRDIEEGEQITCDYTCFDYYCHGHEIAVCQCGSPLGVCYGKIGFKYLPLLHLHSFLSLLVRLLW